MKKKFVTPEIAFIELNAEVILASGVPGDSYDRDTFDAM